jgi:SAM-dependent MidA family methyltransferase
MPLPQNELERLIRQEIEAAGPLPFARFMEFALYHPVHGYYERSVKQIGCQGDFYTSVSVGPLFGELLAFQFSEWLQDPQFSIDSTSGQVKPPSPAAPLRLVEAGAHDGQLAFDILSWLQRQRHDLWPLIEYWILEPSAARRLIQQQQLRNFAPGVHWAQRWEDLPPNLRGIIFSNELLDAFPVVRLGWDSALGAWFEWLVDWNGGRFIWSRGSTAACGAAGLLKSALGMELPGELMDVLPDGFTLELCPEAQEWWSKAASTLRLGKLLTCDYGLEALEFLDGRRIGGTLRTFRQHQPGADPLADIGQQDMTAHVNFSWLQSAGESAGLCTEFFGVQSRFLTAVAEKVFADHSRFGPWTDAATRQFQTLTHPAHLGSAFRVLVQATPR